MAYGVYWRHPNGTKPFKRATEEYRATKGKFKGCLMSRDIRFETLEEAQEKVKRYEARGCEAKIKEVK